MAPVSRVGSSSESGRELAPDPSGLRAVLENDLPASIPVGRATALFCYGHCFHVADELASLELLIAGRRHRLGAAGMARRDLYEWIHGSSGGEADPLGHSYRSGFWGTVVVPAQGQPGQLPLDAVVRLRSGAELRTRLGELEVVPASSPRPDGAEDLPSVQADAIAVCMATYEPDLRLFETQLASLRAQTDEHWVCVVSDGGSTPDRYRADPRAGGRRSALRRLPVAATT